MLSFHEWHPDFNLQPAKKTLFVLSVFHGLSLFVVLYVFLSLPVTLSLSLLPSLGVQGLIIITVLFSLLYGAVGVGYGPAMMEYRALNWLLRLLNWRGVIAVKQQQKAPWHLSLQAGFAGGLDAAENVVVCRLLASSVVSGSMICLCFKKADSRFSLPITLLITPERIGQQDYRRLHVWLRWQSQAALGS